MSIKETGQLKVDTTIEDLIEHIKQLKFYGNDNGIKVTVKKGQQMMEVKSVFIGPYYGALSIEIELEEETK